MIASELRAARKRAGLSQRALAALLNRSTSSNSLISAVETGKTPISLPRLEMFAELLGCEVEVRLVNKNRRKW